MSDLLEGRHRLDKSFQGAALAGGFSFGDVLGAGAVGLAAYCRMRDWRKCLGNFLPVTTLLF